MKSYLYYPDAYSVSIIKRSGDATHLSQTATAFFKHFAGIKFHIGI